MIKNYRFGFSITGLIIYVLQLIPNIIWISFPPVNNVLAQNNSPYPILNIVERVCGISTVALLILIVNEESGRSKKANLYIGLAALFLVAYYISWVFYYKGVVSPWMLIAVMAGMPPLYFLFAGLWKKNYVVIIPCIIFGITHVTITYSTYLLS
jgi:hypothetical protein